MDKIQKIETFIKINLGLAIIILLFWNKFVKEKSSIFLDGTQQFTYYKIILYFALFLLFFFLMYLNLKVLFLSNHENTNTLIKRFKELPFITKSILLFQEYFLNAPTYAYRKITENINLKPFVELPASYFTAYFYFPRIVVFIFFYIPKIIVANIFLFEILFLNKVDYFFKALIILLIPFFIFKILFFIFLEYSKRRLSHLDLFLDINCDTNYDIIINLKHPDILPISPELTLKQIIDSYNVMCNYWIIYSKILKYMEEIKELELKYQVHVNIFVYFCYSFGWLYILYKIMIF